MGKIIWGCCLLVVLSPHPTLPLTTAPAAKLSANNTVAAAAMEGPAGMIGSETMSGTPIPLHGAGDGQRQGHA